MSVLAPVRISAMAKAAAPSSLRDTLLRRAPVMAAESSTAMASDLNPESTPSVERSATASNALLRL